MRFMTSPTFKCQGGSPKDSVQPDMRLKRAIPGESIIADRAARLKRLRDLRQQTPKQPLTGLMAGNSKLGQSGTKFQTVFVWNIPPVVTCPGASRMCLQICYNAENRPDVFPISDWNHNLEWFLYDPEALAQKIRSQLCGATKPSAVRIHSAGDFFSKEYTAFWHRIAKEHESIKFWSYTRSWVIPDLFSSLECLRALRNVQLFASWDNTMPTPPADWRLSLVVDRMSEALNEHHFGSKVVFCPEQISRVPNCACCGFCMKNSSNGVLFTLH